MAGEPLQIERRAVKYSGLLLLHKGDEATLFEMMIRRQGVSDGVFFHNHKRSTVRQSPFLIGKILVFLQRFLKQFAGLLHDVRSAVGSS